LELCHEKKGGPIHGKVKVRSLRYKKVKIKLESSKKTAKELDRFIIDKLSLDQMIPELE
jgi:hypothetical protein